MSELTGEYLRSVIDYNPDTGVFTWRYREDRDAAWNARFAGKPAGSPNAGGGYSRIYVNSKPYLAHRLAFLYMTDAVPSEVDHANCVVTDNSWDNLRAADRTLNLANRRLGSANTSGLKGVCKRSDRNKWRAVIGSGQTLVHLGDFDTAEEAHAAYVVAAGKRYGAFARAG
jgi:HNH endonuclease/AP2 domain